MTDFPSCRALGLAVINPAYASQALNLNQEFIRASDLEALLAKGVRVYAEKVGLGDTWGAGEKQSGSDTHTALLIDIQPIKRETAEDVLRELLEVEEAEGKYSNKAYEIRERARRVLGG